MLDDITWSSLQTNIVHKCFSQHKYSWAYLFIYLFRFCWPFFLVRQINRKIGKIVHFDNILLEVCKRWKSVNLPMDLHTISLSTFFRALIPPGKKFVLLPENWHNTTNGSLYQQSKFHPNSVEDSFFSGMCDMTQMHRNGTLPIILYQTSKSSSEWPVFCHLF